MMQSENTSRTPMQIARQALKEAKAEGLVKDFAVRKAGRATVYPLAGGGKYYTEHVLDTLALLDRLRGERDNA